jgi:hypothetical protein
MADLPQYPLPNPALPFGQQANPTIAQTNPLMSAAQGINAGAQLGLQQQQLNLQRQQQQAAIMAAQVQAQKNKEDFLTNAWGKIAELKNVPDYQNYLMQQLGPVMSDTLSKYGVNVDLSHGSFMSNPSVQTQVTNLMANPNLDYQSKADGLRAIERANPGMEDMNALIEKQANALQEQQKFGFEQEKTQNELAQQWVTNNQSLRGDTVYKQLETQRNAAAQGYDTLTKNKGADGNYNLSNAQIVDLYGQLWKAQTGGVLSPQELSEMNQASLQKNYAKMATFLGMSPNALPTAVGQRLEGMFTNLGNFTDAQHSAMEASKAAKPGGLVDPVKIQSAQAALGRGLTFQQMKDQSDQDFQQRMQNNPEAYLRSIGAKVTPANLKWAQQKI